MRRDEKERKKEVGNVHGSDFALLDEVKKVRREEHQLSKKDHKCFCYEISQITRRPLELILLKLHEDHLQGKGLNSTNHYKLVHKFIFFLQPMKILDGKAAVHRLGEA